MGSIVAAAEVGTEPERWYLLKFYPDGWVELPMMGRAFADQRANLKKMLRLLALVLIAFVGLWLASRFTSSPAVGFIAMLVLLALIGYVGVVSIRMSLRDVRQSLGDGAQLRALRRTGGLPKLTPGTKWYARARSAQQHGQMLTNVRATLGRDIATVTLSRAMSDAADGSLHESPTGGAYVATVRLADGTVRSYRSPDERLFTAFGPFAGSTVN